MDRKFNIGDRVVCVQKYQSGCFPGEFGVVTKYDWQGRCGVKFDNFYAKRHNLQGTVPNGHGWWIPEGYLTIQPQVDLGEFESDGNLDNLFAPV